MCNSAKGPFHTLAPPESASGPIAFLPDSFNSLPTPQVQGFTNQVLIKPGFPWGLPPTVIRAQL